MSKSKEKIVARSLRKDGYSIGDIAKKIEVSKSTVSLWCNDIELTEGQKEKLKKKVIKSGYKGRMLGTLAQKNIKKKKIAECLLRAKKDLHDLTDREFLIAGLCLYWGEGAKTCSNVRFYNSNPKAVLFMMKWFRECLNVDDDRFLMFININEIHVERLNEVIDYWSKLTKIPVEQFRRPTLIKVKNEKVYENFHDHFGTLSIRVSKSKYLLYQILAWIEVIGMAG